MSESTDELHTPRVSVGLPVYNGERYLEGALESLLNQTYHDFELIISDNGSTDGTETICRRYAARDPRIRYERQPTNRGLYWNCNRVCELARGELFKWAAVDDLHAPTFLERCIEVLDTHPDVVCCHSRGDYIDPAGHRLYAADPSGEAHLGTSPSPHRRFRDVLLHHGWGARMFALSRLEPLRRTGLLQPHYGWDKVMMADLAFAGRFHMVDEVLYFERDHPAVESQRNKDNDDEQRKTAAPLVATVVDREGKPFHRIAFVKGYIQAATRRSPNIFQWLCCMGWVAAYMLQVRKGMRLVAAAVGRMRDRCSRRFRGGAPVGGVACVAVREEAQ